LAGLLGLAVTGVNRLRDVFCEFQAFAKFDILLKWSV
jgi:hypothetical protein